MNLSKKNLIAAGFFTLAASLAFAHEQTESSGSEGNMMGKGMGMMNMMDMEQMGAMMKRCDEMMTRMEQHLDKAESE